MATQDNSPGLLSKVAKFVLNPTKDWDDIGKKEPEPSAEFSKLALKQMIERKQYNDSVRKREFDKLRKIRQQASSVMAPGIGAKPSNFQDSWEHSIYEEEKAVTLKKIDDIEAQMSKQWWKGRAQAAAAGQAAPAPQNQRETTQAAESSAQDEAESSFAATVASNLLREEDEMPTQMGGLAPGVEAPDLLAFPSRLASPAIRPSVPQASPSTGTMPLESDPNQADPTLEEAAIRFANGDDAGAEAVLVSALQVPDASPVSAHAWAAALFDVFRCTDQKTSFDRLALEFVQRFGCTAPVWFSVRQALGLGSSLSESVSSTSRGVGGALVWRSPATLDEVAVAQLQALVASAAGACCLDWHTLQTITPEAGQALGRLFARWCDQPLVLRFEGAQMLSQVLSAHTPMEDQQIDRFWWQLRLDSMRIMRLQDEFESVALDFCVTYEVSPPPWQLARCQFAYEQVAPATDTASLGNFEFSGELLGDAEQALRPLRAASAQGGELVVSCAHLIRVDFSTAGSILNWVAHAQTTGCRVELRDVPRLIAVFFNLIGINEHAHVIVRTN